MSGMLASLVGAASAVLNLRSNDSPASRPAATGDDGFASALSSARASRQRETERAEASREQGRPVDDAQADVDALAAERAEERRAAGRASAKRDTEEAAEAVDEAPAADEPGSVRRSADEVNRSLEALSPEFRERLERVIARMESEHGHKVQIVETFRDQARQDHLFAQGRTRPGPVVTWTTSSNHTHGRAADLLVDGTYDNPLAMVRLARIASEEGLRTLGSRDPGHVELPTGVHVERVAVGEDAGTSLLASASSRASEAARSAAGGAGVARVADVAVVAQVAPVARVASVSGLGGGAGRIVACGRAVVVDGGVHQLSDLCGIGRRARGVPPLVLGNGAGATTPTHVLGSLCLPDDVLAECCPLPSLSAGDVLAFPNAGAYGLAASPYRFLGHPAPAEVAFTRTESALLRAREPGRALLDGQARLTL